MADKVEPCQALCKFLRENEITVTTFLPKAEFDKLARAKKFVVGPFLESFGDGYGEPYNPDRQIFGKLEDNTCAFTTTKS